MKNLKITSAMLNKNLSKALILSLVFLFYTNNIINAQGTEIPAGDVSGTWTQAGSPYNINGEITIQSATTLTIEPGVVVEFQGHYKLIVEGRLLAIGTQTDTIEFTINDTTGFANTETTNGGWHGIRFVNNTSADSSKIVYCKLHYGKATDGDGNTITEDDKGGAIYVNGFSKLLIKNCLISNNYAEKYGGGIYDYESELIVTNNKINHNNAYFGGAIFSRGSGSHFDNITLSNNYISYNNATNGGAIYLRAGKFNISNNVIYNNTASFMGGAIDVYYSSKAYIYNNKITNNKADHGAGIMFEGNHYSKVIGNVIANNYSTYNNMGAGIYIQSTSSTTLDVVNNTIANNQGEGIYAGESFIVQNSIISGNSTQIAGTATVEYCNIEGGYTGTGNISIDPQFVNPSSGIGIQEDALTADWSLLPASFAANAGTPDTTGLGLPETDIVGNERVYGGVIDMGAYELNQPIERSGTITENTTWNADTVNITGDIIINNGIILTITDGNIINFTGHYKIDVQGTILAVGTETDTIVFTYNDTTGFSNNSTNDGGWSGIKFDNTPASNDSSKFAYCRFEFGKANIGSAFIDSVGGSLYINGFSKVAVRHSRFSNNYASMAAGAVFVLGANPVFDANIISNNKSDGYAGGIGFINNANLNFVNNIVCNNNANFGGGMAFNASSGTFINNTIVNNKALTSGGGINCESGSSPTFRNTILFGNTAKQIYLDDDSSDPDFTYCDIEGGSSDISLNTGVTFNGTYDNNYDFNPGFETPSAGAGTNFDGVNADWSLQVSSSCLNSGDTNQTALPTEDFDGNSRVYNGRVDIGAYELQQAKEICGHITEDSFWAGDTIKITCETIIDAGVTLTIDPGTVVDFTGYYKLIVQGVILAEGTKTDSITFTTNDEATGWHGIRFDGNSSTDSSKFIYCIFENGKATGAGYEATGGAIYTNAFSLILIENSLFKNNSSIGGGAIYLRSSSPVIVNNKFINNNGGNYYGGAIACEGGSSSIINNLFTNNTAEKGGALSINSNVVITNNTIANNHATTYGGGIHFDNTYTENIKNCIIYGNTATTGNQIFLYDDNSDPDFTNCDIQGGTAAFGLYTDVTYNGTYTNNIDSYPQFTNPSSGVGNQSDAFTSEWTLKDISPCINTGTTDTTGLNLPLVDIIGNPRVINDIIDMGAYESLVTNECGNISSNTTWDADTVKVSCDITIDDSYTLTIEPGTYVEFQGHYKIDVKGRLLAIGNINDSISFSINDTTGFSNTGSDAGSWQGIIFNNTSISNDTSKFVFCKFEYGKVRAGTTPSETNSGGMFYINSFSKILIQNCLIENNYASMNGGAIALNHASPVIKNNTIYKNRSSQGAGIYFTSSSNSKIINNLISNNYCKNGGGIYFTASVPILTNNLISNNFAESGGGIMIENSSNAVITNNTISNNDASFQGGGIHCWNSSSVIKNTIFYGNTASKGNQVFLGDDDSDPDFSYCDIEGGTANFGLGGGVTYNGTYENNIDEDPLFVSPSAGTGTEYNGLTADWSLQSTTPCLNTGTPDVTGLDLPDLDLANNPRIYNNVRVEIGGYEYQNNPPEISTQSFNVDENSPNSTVVATVVANDVDGNEYSFLITDGNTNGAFAISSSGQITVANTDELDYETVPEQKFDLTVQVQDNGIGNLTDTSIVTININDVNDAPVIDPFEFSIDENSNNASIVGTVSGTDEDVPAQTLSYSITGEAAAGYFVVNSSSGEITVSDSTGLNYETNPTLEIIVQAQDNGTGNMTDTTLVTINLNDVNDVPVILNQSFTIDEQSENGTLIGTIVASDEDLPAQNLLFSIIAGNDDEAFYIIGNSGELSVYNSDSIDYEIETSKLITVEVVDNGTGTLSNQADITINLNNINDNAPVFNDTIVYVDENSSEGTLVVELEASDIDNLGSLSFSFVEGNENSIFYLQNGNGNKLYISKHDSMNYELYPSFELLMSVSDGDLTTQATLTINLNDLNEYPVIETQYFNIDELSSNGTVVGTIIATDPDIGQSLYYFITSGNYNDAFILDSVSGEILVLDSTKLDHEGSYPSYVLYIKVKDNGIPQYYSVNYVSITVNDVNEPPIVEAQSFSVNENAYPNTIVGGVSYTHDDQGQTVIFSIFSGNEDNIFSINENTGNITVAISDSLDYETNPTFEFIVQVTDNTTEALSDTATITINLNDINEYPVIVDQEFFIDENSPSGIVVDTVMVTDPDANESFSYQISGWDYTKAFGINSEGVFIVNIADSLNFEEHSSFNYTVIVQDSYYNTSWATITININDINEIPIINHYYYYIEENNPVNTIVGIVDAETDAGETLKFSITSGNYNDVFGIDSVSGEIYVANSDNLNYELNSMYDITISATDDSPENLTGEGFITIYVTNVNDAPVISEVGNQSTPMNITRQMTVIFTDEDTGDSHTITVISDNANVSVENISGNTSGSPYKLVPASNWTGTSNITVTVQDYSEAYDIENYILTVTEVGVNYPPVISEVGNQSTPMNITKQMTVTFTDANPDDIHTITVISDEANVNIENLSGNISGSTYDLVPASDWTGTANITVTVRDNSGTDNDTDTETYVLNVIITLINHPPVVQNPIDDMIIYVDSVFNFIVPENTFFDPDENDNLSYSATLSDGNNLPDWLTFNEYTKTFNGTPSITDTSIISVKLTAVDDSLASAFVEFNITIKVLTNINELAESVILIFPNPTENYFNISLDKVYSKQLFVNIRNIKGEIVLKEKYKNISDNFNSQIDVSNLPAGIYLVEIELDSNIIIRKIFIY